MNFSKIIAEEMENLGDSFCEGELAYLAITSKIELPIRDRLAFRLHKRLAASGYYVCREWNRIDIAILDTDGSPLALLELKAMITADALGADKPNKYIDQRVIGDFEKMKKFVNQKYHSDSSIKIFGLLLAAHHHKIPENVAVKKLYKYQPKIKISLVASNQENLRKSSTNNINKLLHKQDLSIISNGILAGGAAFEHQADVCWWLTEKTKMTPLSRV